MDYNKELNRLYGVLNDTHTKIEKELQSDKTPKEQLQEISVSLKNQCTYYHDVYDKIWKSTLVDNRK